MACVFHFLYLLTGSLTYGIVLHCAHNSLLSIMWFRRKQREQLKQTKVSRFSTNALLRKRMSKG